MPYCCVPYCTSSSKYNKNLSFHEIPVDPHLRDEWCRRIFKSQSIVDFRKFMTVCCEHFSPEDFTPDLKLKRLKKSALPRNIPDVPEGLSLEAFKKSISNSRRRLTKERRWRKEHTPRHEEPQPEMETTPEKVEVTNPLQEGCHFHSEMEELEETLSSNHQTLRELKKRIFDLNKFL